MAEDLKPMLLRNTLSSRITSSYFLLKSSNEIFFVGTRLNFETKIGLIKSNLLQKTSKKGLKEVNIIGSGLNSFFIGLERG